MIMVEESTRRLPNWMLGVSVTADNDNNKKKNITDEPEDEEDEANLAKNSKFEAKRRKRNKVKDNKELDDDTDNDVNKKTSNRPGRTRKAKSKAEIKAECEEKEGEELTVEDLVSIAEEVSMSKLTRIHGENKHQAENVNCKDNFQQQLLLRMIQESLSLFLTANIYQLVVKPLLMVQL